MFLLYFDHINAVLESKRLLSKTYWNSYIQGVCVCITYKHNLLMHSYEEK